MTSITIYYYRCYILLLFIIINLLLCLKYKLTFTISMYVKASIGKKHSIYRVQCYTLFCFKYTLGVIEGIPHE